MIFATLVLEREPLQVGEFLAALIVWVQNAGGVASLALAVWAIAILLQRLKVSVPLFSDRTEKILPTSDLFVYGSLFCFVGYLAIVFLSIASGESAGLSRFVPRTNFEQPLTVGDYIMTACGAFALAIAVYPIFTGLFGRLGWGRIVAMGRLSFKEAVRSRIVLVFSAMALVFLFADWFVPFKPEDQIRNYVRVVYWTMTPLFLITALMLGSFSIPNDVKNMSIHTIVTKPVEKFEIVLGRFFGYGLLLTIGVAAIALVSLGFILRTNVTDEAAKESYKARVALFGDLSFFGTKSAMRGESVGREWEYRSYISGPQPNLPRQYAIWSFGDLPGSLGRGVDSLRFEYTFDIFRLSKGEEGKDIACTFTLAEGHLSMEEVQAAQSAFKKESDTLEAEARAAHDKALVAARSAEETAKAIESLQAKLKEIRATLIQKHRVLELAGQPVTDYHTQSLEVPAIYFTSLMENASAKNAPDGKPYPQLRVFVSVDRSTSGEAQMLGVARRDLYLIAAELPFWQNFLKGIVGMWCLVMLVLGIAVSCSTYLSGLISLFLTAMIYGLGSAIEYLHQVAEKRVEGGGPLEGFTRLATRKQLAVQLEDSPATSLIKGGDEFFSWIVRRLLNLVPDVSRFDLHQYVANGFDISWSQVLFMDNLVPLVGYLLPWAILSYYLMKYREIANPS
jgi:hypothetical protein